jgi:aspartyl aminopeptidase
MLSIGHPLLGDRLYANPQALAAWPAVPACLMLSFTHPYPASGCVRVPGPLFCKPAWDQPAPTAAGVSAILWELACRDRATQFVGQYVKLAPLLSGVTYARRVEPGLIDFLKASPTPFHATASLVQRLEAAGFQRLDERDSWATEPGGRYYVTRNDSSIIAIKLGRTRRCWRYPPGRRPHRQPVPAGQAAARTAAPGLLQLGVEVYGGALLARGSTATCRWPAASPSAATARSKAS